MTTENSGPRRASAAMRLLEEIAGAPLTFGGLLRATREGEGETQEAFATRLGVSKSHLSDIENARKVVSAARAARWAEVLGYSPRQFVQLALQDELREAGLPFRVQLSHMIEPLVMPTREEDRAITAAAKSDPDAQPLTPKQLKAMVPMRALRPMSYRGYSACMTFDPVDKIFAGRVLDVEDILCFHGESVSEFEANFHTAVDGYIAACEQLGGAPAHESSRRATPPTT